MDGDQPASEYDLEELARLSGVPARTIRFYQSKGALPRPRRQGRQGLYDEGHLARLRLIGELQDRGLKLSSIRDLLSDEGRAGRSVADWLGLEEALRGPWSEDRPRLLSEDELSTLLGDRRPGTTAELERAGFLVRPPEAAPGSWLAPSPSLLELALRLLDAGVPVELAGEARDLLRRRLARAADDLVDLFAEWDGGALSGRVSSTEVGATVAALQPIARQAAGVVLAQEIERALRRLVERPGSTERARRRSRR